MRGPEVLEVSVCVQGPCGELLWCSVGLQIYYQASHSRSRGAERGTDQWGCFKYHCFLIESIWSAQWGTRRKWLDRFNTVVRVGCQWGRKITLPESWVLFTSCVLTPMLPSQLPPDSMVVKRTRAEVWARRPSHRDCAWS